MSSIWTHPALRAAGSQFLVPSFPQAEHCLLAEALLAGKDI